MTTPFQQLLETYRDNSKTKHENGNYFEKLVKVFLENDERYAPQFTKVQSYVEWANENGILGVDSGIDLVATNVDGSYSAIQCKFYQTSVITKPEIDSFISASDRDMFTRRILIDTSEKGLNKLAEEIFNSVSKSPMRITLHAFEESSIDWSSYLHNHEEVKHFKKKELRPHQREALDFTSRGFASGERGKLLMACGTGKTFTALKIAEHLAGQNKRVLFLVPSLALMSQTITEWSQQSQTKLHAFAVCSDTKVGKRNSSDDDLADINIHDLAYPATTDAKKLAEKIQGAKTDEMTVVFSTYQSIEVISKAQLDYGMADFDLIICDEAHRTTGATLAGEDDSNFVKIHDNEFIKGAKRLYMTATPRIYMETVKEKAKEKSAELFSMDDTAVYGEVFYSLKFGEAVEKGLLTDYKVLVLAVDEGQVSRDIQKYFADSESGLQLDDATKIIGCYKALIKEKLEDLGAPMKRAVSFCKSIKASETFTREFQAVINAYMEQNPGLEVKCELDHVDGKMDAAERETKLNWLKQESEDTCRILSNARCLSEGVDVPSLDAVMFIHGRKSKVDIVQSVGRVMRVAPNKKLGYVIIPVAIPAGVSPEDALNNNANYQIVWDVLNALRSHDERLDSNINKVDLLENTKDKIQAIKDRIEIVAAVDTLPQKQREKKSSGVGGNGGYEKGDNDRSIDVDLENKVQELDLVVDSVQRAILAKVVEKCGTRTYWEDWATDIAKIADRHITRIKTTLENQDSVEYKTFIEFVTKLRNNLNDSITEEEVIEMLAQHIITRPVFNALFSDYNFADNNSISKSMQSVLDVLDAHHISNEAESLDKFYQSVKRRADGIDNPEAKQKIVVELYDKFFRNAFPRMTERLGIVYTPVECVDFIIHSVNDILKQEFNQELGDRNTHIIDPFTGTGTFITRLMQSGLLSKEQLEYKYNLQEKTVNGEKVKTTELHANEIVLLAYYIASINIEAVYHAIVGGKYKSFEGICLTDTFQLTERDEDLITPQLNEKYHCQIVKDKLPIRVFIGNPPYSAGQSRRNNGNQNLRYPKLDERVRDSYEKHGTSRNNNSLYDSYIRAIRWASDRIDKYGIIGFITNAGWIESNSADGMRKCLQKEFSSIYVFHLRGNARISGELSRKDGGKIFANGSRAPIAISIFVKNPRNKEQGKIYFYEIEDYLTRKEKLNSIANLRSVSTITSKQLWKEIIPDQYNDWLNQRDDSFYDQIAIGNKQNNSGPTVFENFTLGLSTGKDAWVYNFSNSKLQRNVSNMVDFYNSELERYQASETIKNQPKKLSDAEKYVAGFVNNNNVISWAGSNYKGIIKNIKTNFEQNCFMVSLYRPFTKLNVYYSKLWNERIYQLEKIFPEHGISNLMIGATGIGLSKKFSALMSNTIIDLQLLANGQWFPLYLYELKSESTNGGNFSDDADVVTATSGKKYTRRDAITDDGLIYFTDFYHDNSISKEDVFYYIYGLFHSEEYRSKYADNLTKALPRIIRVKTIADFRNIEDAGRKLADLHLNYESKEMYPVSFAKDISNLTDKDYYLTKMKFASKTDKSKIIYNSKITIEGIPEEAYEYLVNGKSAIEWVMERQGVSTHKDSGIINDANDWAIETMDNPRYPLELLQRVITVSIETVKIVGQLPKLDI